MTFTFVVRGSYEAEYSTNLNRCLPFHVQLVPDRHFHVHSVLEAMARLVAEHLTPSGPSSTGG